MTIYAAVIIIVCVTAGNNYVKEKQFQKLNALAKDISIPVTRGGKMKSLSVFSLLVGDVIQINTGDKIPADCVLYSGNSILSDESNMTGETIHLKKEGVD